jgi:ribosomal-protein-alanine N-acetyltransferase
MNSLNNITFRRSTVDDVDEMTILDQICFSVPWTKADFTKEMTTNDLALYIVAEVNQKIIGYAGLWCIVDEGHITNVAVHPDYRGQGLGKNLVEIMLSEARKKGKIKSFTLEVRVTNEAAINLYEGFGFVEVGRRLGYYSDNKEDAAIMWLMDV